jgi:hypothetical protein
MHLGLAHNTPAPEPDLMLHTRRRRRRFYLQHMGIVASSVCRETPHT